MLVNLSLASRRPQPRIISLLYDLGRGPERVRFVNTWCNKAQRPRPRWLGPRPALSRSRPRLGAWTTSCSSPSPRRPAPAERCRLSAWLAGRPAHRGNRLQPAPRAQVVTPTGTAPTTTVGAVLCAVPAQSLRDRFPHARGGGFQKTGLWLGFPRPFPEITALIGAWRSAI
jgi:hypothetical protein